MTTIERILLRMRSHNTLLCCGLDPDMGKLPKQILASKMSDGEKVRTFLKTVIDITAPHVCAYKAQKAFFDVIPDGHNVLRYVIRYIHALDSAIPVIIDCKIGDIDNTMDAYCRNLFDVLEADGVVANPFMGDDVLRPLANKTDKAIIVLARTSNPLSRVVQDVLLEDGRQLWQHILDLIIYRWNYNKNMIPVLSSRGTCDFSEIRKKIPDQMPILLAGIGAQGGSYNDISALLNGDGVGVIVNSSRNILFSKYDKEWEVGIAQSAISIKNKINKSRER